MMKSPIIRAGCTLATLLLLASATFADNLTLIPAPARQSPAATAAADRPVTTPQTSTTAHALHTPAPLAPPASHPAPPPPTADSTRREPAKINVNKQLRINIAWQIALDAVDFSPGIIDGHFKRKSLMALTDYRDRFFPGLSPFDPKIFHALNVDVDGAITTYEITADDASQVGMVPEGWNEKAKLDRLPYESLAECLSEKFHCTKGMLETLNPGVQLESLEPGESVNVPNLHPFPADNKAVVLHKWSNTGSVTVDLAEKTIRVFDKEGNELALFHCSIARDKAKLPDRDTKVQVIAAPNPQYTFNPKLWPEVKDVTQILQIPPGPRNPVGLAWVGLDLPGYGIHGTPKPELIGKTGSHGCFRLTNWDALKFAGYVQIGTPVKVMNPEKTSPN